MVTALIGTLTKQVKIVMDAYRINTTAETSIVTQLNTMRAAGQTNGQSDRFSRSHYLEVGYYNVTTWYFVDAAAAQSWIDFYSGIVVEYNMATQFSCVIQDYDPNGSWQVNIAGPNAWNVHYAPPV